MSIRSSWLFAWLLAVSPALADGISTSLTSQLGGGVVSSGNAPVFAFAPCVGGTRTTAGANTVITFTAGGPLNCAQVFTANEVLVVAGGGSGTVGGGGAGGVIDATNVSVASGSTAVAVGAGGVGTPRGTGNPGGNSVFGSLVAIGGGSGGVTSQAPQGGSGGGCSNQINCSGGPGTPLRFNCASGFTASGPCTVGGVISAPSAPYAVTGTTSGSVPVLSGSAINLINAGITHAAMNVNYQPGLVNLTQGFSTTFTFVPNGWNIALILNNSTNNPFGFNGSNFSNGAGCEGSFFQGFPGNPPNAVPDHVFALELDQWSSLTGGDNTFTYSSAQIYNTGAPHSGTTPQPASAYPGQSPCNPDLGNTAGITNPADGSLYTYVGVGKFSTSPVALNSPANSPLTTTGNTYSATIIYSGTTLTLNLFNVTLGGSCPGASCFTQTWTSVNIPSIVGAGTAWIGLGGGTNEPVSNALLVNGWALSVPGVVIQGNNGGTTAGFGGSGPGGGGGGCGAPGGNATSGTVAGNGGNGCSSSITGTAVIYAGGGGATTNNTSGGDVPGTGGTGGGGAGSITTTPNNGVNGLGGGGGGGGGFGSNAGSGGSGVVIISCVTGTC